MQEASHNWNANGSQNQSAPYLYSPQTPMPYGAYPWQGYHIYGCSITASNITWYIDGVQENQIATPPAAYMNSPFYVMVDYTIGGGWPVSGTPFNTGGSSSLLVDWVRVYSQLTQAAPPTLAATLSGGTVLLTFPAESGFQYQVEYKNTLNTAAWNLLGEPIAGSGVVETATDSAGQTNRFYRLQVQLQ